MSHSRTYLLSTLALLGMACWSLPAVVNGSDAPAEPAADHGAPAEGPVPAAEGHGAPPAAHGAPAADAHAAPEAQEPPRGAGASEREIDDFKLGKQLESRFDITVLKNRARICKYRMELVDISHPIRSTPKFYLQFSCVVEFGNQSGVVELRENLFPVEEDIRKLVHVMTFKALSHHEGKQELKLAVAEVINRRMLTARVRAVYLTDFKLSKNAP